MSFQVSMFYVAVLYHQVVKIVLVVDVKCLSVIEVWICVVRTWSIVVPEARKKQVQQKSIAERFANYIWTEGNGMKIQIFDKLFMYGSCFDGPNPSPYIFFNILSCLIRVFFPYVFLFNSHSFLYQSPTILAWLLLDLLIPLRQAVAHHLVTLRSFIIQADSVFIISSDLQITYTHCVKSQ